ncbi:sensor histidine kinase [Methylophaga sp. OBS1]|uniref:sensor histidine kinase n=1 Tax=Methylophaga sp. OBS1 TaxID=2991933 RepID=UPI00224CFFBF|nr:sensor histidine kinase [Methylophaga sp. OBS1]MCX4193966.1 sensor histidine kinase [Methylophaga sp. OBS1]
MKRRLFWKLSAVIVAGTVSLFWLIHTLVNKTEQHMSFIDEAHQQTLYDYAAKAEQLYVRGDEAGLAEWLQTIREKENTWVAVVQPQIQTLAGSQLSRDFKERFRLGRSIDWKIHLYFKANPVMDVIFADGKTHFLITLPQRMRPGTYWQHANLLLQLALPLLLMAIISVVIYRHVMSPLRQLERATQQFSQGNFDVRLRNSLGTRNDEITALAETFDGMAERIGNLIQSQRHLTSDLSHELRTPLTRIELALSWAEQNTPDSEPLKRIREECQQMRQMVEDTLSLAWLENEQPILKTDELDLTDLIDSIVEDARFEFPNHHLSVELPEHAPLTNSSDRALGHAIENIIRNALTHTAEAGTVTVSLSKMDKFYLIQIDDQGPGVAEKYLEDIFNPFFRLGRASRHHYQGFGVGLSLAKRQIEAVGGKLTASNLSARGLRMTIRLPAA